MTALPIDPCPPFSCFRDTIFHKTNINTLRDISNALATAYDIARTFSERVQRAMAKVIQKTMQRLSQELHDRP